MNIGLILAAILALGAVTGFAQDPCTDATGQGAASDNITALFGKRKDPNGYDKLVEAAKQFLEKYGNCESAKAEGGMVEYLLGKPGDANKPARLPQWEKAAADAKAAAAEAGVIARFNTALSSKNWDELYASGKELMAKNPDKYRDIELAFGTIGYDETFKKNTKYNDQTLLYAKQSIADLESGKTFSDKVGVPTDFAYKTKANALGWMNLIVGYLTQVDKKDKAAAAPYLYKATQADSPETKNNPIPYELIGGYYFDELNKLVEQIQTAAKDQKDTDTPEVAQQKIDNIKKLVAQSNGVAERAMDAYSRAYNLGKDPAYKAKMKQNVADAYKLRFNKTDGVDTWIASTIAKPFVNPTTPVAPISDPEPVKTEAANTAPAATTTTTVSAPATVKPATTPAKPAAPPAKPATKPSGAKVAATVKKKTT